jgi:hypothetical protein
MLDNHSLLYKEALVRYCYEFVWLIFIRYEINIIGAIFWIVIISKQFTHLNPSITLGNHQCSGAAPVLIVRGL